MIKFITNYFQHKDDRGSITGLVNFGQWEELNIIESEAGVKRGNHYHKNTQELFVILDGKIKISLQNIQGDRLAGEIKEYEVKQGDVFMIEINTNHVFEILEKSRWINMLSIKTDEKLPDIVRVK
ncbi:MAG: cupin domain-containing protein [Epsilonproteobacteria bacterium]|nr:cupin domain-containing protein [Campylobacterota bacterium]